uniref:SFRICE_008081 n=1 Tax=Spodoptera frugiperda TaxID=7108 RepID=A0A2H1WHI3_SPOFR
MPKPEYDGSRCTTPVRLAIILPTNAASEITGKQTILFDKRSSLIFNMMITNSVQSAVYCIRVGTLVIIWCLLDVDFRDTLYPV